MGSPVSVVIAEIVMQKIEDLIMPCINDSITFWFRYVDDVITCVKNDHSTEVLSKINSINNNIQFTVEEESDSCLNYLDMKIIKKNNGSLKFDIYRKSTHTDNI